MDPIGAAAGGVIAICLIVVLPFALGVHVLVRRHPLLLLLSTLAVPVAFTLVMFALGWAMDEPSNESLRRASRALAWWSFWPALIASSLAAAPVFAYTLYRRFQRRSRSN